MTQSSDPNIQRIIQEIEKLGIKKKSVAEKAGISQVHFSYILNGTRPLTDEMKKDLFDLLEIE